MITNVVVVLQYSKILAIVPDLEDQKGVVLFPKIETAYDFGVGINTGYIKDDLTEDSKLDKRYHPMVPGTTHIDYYRGDIKGGTNGQLCD